MKYKIILLLFLLAQIRSVYCQDFEDNSLYAPPSPTAMGLLRYANTNVNLHTGTPNINLPIVDLKGRNVGVSVSLSYEGSGNKVQDIASWVGLGWSLNAGGLITRIVRGRPDEYPFGYCGGNNVGEKVYEPLTNENAAKFNSGEWDSEPDMFYYNFMGVTGKFILNENRTPVMVPYTKDLEIELITGNLGVIKGWIVTNANGIIYKFGNTDNSVEVNECKLSGSTKAAETFPSSWYLTTVDHPMPGEDVTLSYMSGDAIAYKYYTQVYTERVGGQDIYANEYCTSASPTTTDRDTEIAIASPKYLSEIRTTHGRIVFSSLPGRSDLSGARFLDVISLYDDTYTLVESYKFNYSYFQSDDCSTSLCRRLRLNTIVRSSLPQPLYSFGYNTANLPARDSHAIDHWGYFNSNIYSSKIPLLTDAEQPCPKSYAGADKQPDPVRSLANILTTITYPTGGYSEYVYGIHDYFDGAANLSAGGARINEILECAGSDCKRTLFEYRNFDSPLNSSGALAGLPVYSTRSKQKFNTFVPCVPVPCPVSYWQYYIIIHSTSQVQLFDLNGYHISYSNVRVINSDGGYTKNVFTSLSNGYSDKSADQFNYSTANGRTNNIASNRFPFTPNTSSSFARGYLLSRVTYNKLDKPLMSETFQYDTLFFSSRVPALKVALQFSTLGLNGVLIRHYAVGKYYIESKPWKLVKQTTVTHDETTPSIDPTGMAQTTEIAYNSRLFPIQSVIYNPAYPALKSITRTKYVDDYYYNGTPPVQSAMEAIQFMKEKKQFASPVEIVTLNGNAGKTCVIGASAFVYQKFPAAQPFATLKEKWVVNKQFAETGSSSETGSPYSAVTVDQTSGNLQLDPGMTRFNFMDYDPSTGNMIFSKSADGVSKSYGWDGNGLYISSIVSDPEANGYQVSYQHKPLVGVTKKTDPNLRNAWYEYDGQESLLLARNHDTHITNRYRSNYSTLSGPDFSVTGTMIPNSPITFSFSDSKTVGTNRYRLYFGDGQVFENPPLNLSHSYAAGGTYTVKLEKFNPEFGLVSTSKQVTIYPPPTVNAGSDPDNANICEAYFTSCLVSASVSGGCPGGYTVQWYRIYPDGRELYMGTDLQFTFIVETVGTHQFRCVVTDACGQVGAGETAIIVYRGDPNCPY